jgi:hypothetical protein
MWTETSEGRALIADLSKSIVIKVAPEELDLFDELMGEYFEDPAPPDLSISDDDEALGFGTGEALVVVTPAVAAAVSGVATYILKEVLKTVQQESASILTRRVKNFFNPREKPDELTKAQMAQVRNLVLEQALAFGMDADQAQGLSNAVIGSLFLGT